MDETAKPHDDAADELDATDAADAGGTEIDDVDPPVTASDTLPRPEVETELPPPDPFGEAPGDVPAPSEEPPPLDAPDAAEDATPEAAALSLDDMVTELTTDESPVGEEELEAEAAEVEAEMGESAEGPAESGEAGEEVTEAAPTSWRDEVATEAAIPTLVRQRLSMRSPFWVYGGVWVVFIGAMTYLMWPLSATPFVDTQYYGYFVLGCAVLLALGPVLGLAAWLWGRSGATPEQRAGLVRAVSLRCATWMTVGVALMWICLYVLDLHRTGVIR
jgi:hypothetical protein